MSLAVGLVHNGAKPSFRKSFGRISVWGTLRWSKWVWKLGFGPLCRVFRSDFGHYGWTETGPEAPAALASGGNCVVLAQTGALPEGGALSTRVVLKGASDVKPIPYPTPQCEASRLTNHRPGRAIDGCEAKAV